MSVRVRLARAGAKKRPVYRVVVSDTRSPRDGRFIEQIGQYDPRQEPVLFNVKEDRLQHWLSHGATTSETVHRLLLKQKREAAKVAKAPS